MLRVRDLMRTHVYRVERGETVATVARTMIFHDVESMLVVDGDELLGIITERDLLKAVLPTPAEFHETESARAFADLVTVARDHFAEPVESVMTRPVRTIDRDESLIRALGTMLSARIRRMPVVGPAGDVVGVVTQHDLLRAVFLELNSSAP